MSLKVFSGNGPEVGYIDFAGAATGGSAITQRSTLVVTGWAADTSSGAPVTSVTIFVDGANEGEATLGIQRPDVAQALGRNDYIKSGWSFQMSTAALGTGTHTVSATATGPSGTVQIGSKTITIEPDVPQEIGSVDVAGTAAGSATLAQGSMLYVAGWAADTISGAPVTSVTVFVDGINEGQASLGIQRPDVTQAFGRSDYANSGWTFQMLTVLLATGAHTVTVSATGPSGTAEIGSKTINVQASPPTEIGSIDLAGTGTGNSTLTQGATLSMAGWAADLTSGQVTIVIVFIDGVQQGKATIGLQRPDVAQAYHRNDYAKSGWSFQMSTASLSPGTHSIVVAAVGPSGAAEIASKTVMIQANVAQEIGNVDVVGTPGGSATLAQGSTLYVAGWAADTIYGAPVTSVTVSVDGIDEGHATLGIQRTDVASAFGQANYINSGWSFQMSTIPLSVGPHTITVTVNGYSGTAQIGSNTINVQPGTASEIGSIDLAGTGTGNSTLTQGATLSVAGWAADLTSGAPVTSVIVFIDGVQAGTATIGLQRADVAQAYRRNDYTNSGWSFQVSTASLVPGTHTVLVGAVGPSGTAEIGSKTITIQANVAQEIGNVDVVGTPGGSATLTQGSTLYVAGWAADTIYGAPVTSVTVSVDGIDEGHATLGIQRTDVASAFGRANYINSGWSFQMSTIPLSVGPHTIIVTVNGYSGTAQIGSNTINVQPGTASEIGSIDLAGTGTGNSTLTQGATLSVAGWAADLTSGAPVTSVIVFIDGVQAGTATIGLQRVDVSQAYGRNDYTNSGWSFQVSTASLVPGTHTVSVGAVGPSGTAEIGSKTITIQTNVAQEIGNVDVVGTPGGSATLTQGSTLYVAGWAADTIYGAPVRSVTVSVDGIDEGHATLGIQRTDVANAFGQANYINSGWSFQVSTASLTTGTHTITVTANGWSGTSQIGSSTILIQ